MNELWSLLIRNNIRVFAMDHISISFHIDGKRCEIVNFGGFYDLRFFGAVNRTFSVKDKNPPEELMALLSDYVEVQKL